MIKPLRWLLWLVGLGAVALGASWLVAMPGKEIRGTWATEGYGLHFDIGRTVIDVYEVTAISCHHSRRIPAHTWLIRAMQDITLTRAGNRLQFDADSSLGPVMADHSDGLPPTCPQTPAQSGNAQDNFDVFWQAMDEHYPFFDLHGVNWTARRQAFRPTDDVVLDSNALFDLFQTTLAGLDDGNLSIRATDGRIHSPVTVPDWFDDRHLVRDNTLAQFTDLKPAANTGLLYGWATPEIGYVYMAHMDSNGGFNVKGTDLARAGFAEIALAFSAAEGVILDLRYNPGGSAAIALEYARYFTDAPRTAFTRSIRTNSGDGVSYNVVLTPHGSDHISQPTIILTSEFTAGAAEVFAMTMRDLPQVTVVGTATSGALSDVARFTLPNGWILGLPHQRYTAPDGARFAGTGIIPDQIAPADIPSAMAGRDTTLEQAIIALSKP